MAAISAIAEYPGRVEEMFVNTELSDVGIYAVKQYLLGVPFTQIVDDYLPVTDSGSTIFGGFGKDGSVWGPIVEKAFAKRYGNWQRINRGWMSAAVTTMNGSPSKDYHHDLLDADEIWRVISTHDVTRDVMTAASPNCGDDS